MTTRGHHQLLMGASGGPAPPNVAGYYQGNLFTGNGGSTRSIPGVDLTGGGISWFKNRTSAVDHGLMFTPNGSSPQLVATNTSTAAAAAAATFTASGTDLTSNAFNTSAADFVNWSFRKAANFVDVVTYTGNGANRTIAHSLGVAPALILIKRTDASLGGAWQCYHDSLGNGSIITLAASTATASPTSWNSTSPTSSVFSVGTNGAINTSGRQYVALLFAHDTSPAGLIRGFTYTGNGLATGPTVSLGWQPQYLFLIPDSVQDRPLFDTSRTPGFTGNDALLQPNTNSAETAGANVLQLVSGGFQPLGTTSVTNASGRVFYGLAVRAP